LLHALGLELAKKPKAIVRCLSTQDFIAELIAAIEGDRVDWWRARYRASRRCCSTISAAGRAA